MKQRTTCIDNIDNTFFALLPEQGNDGWRRQSKEVVRILQTSTCGQNIPTSLFWLTPVVHGLGAEKCRDTCA